MKFNSQTSAIFLIVVIQLNLGVCKRIRKRQIYREQVQLHTGGKIPDSAFQTDRLLLNRLQKEGIAVPDGVVLEQRNPKVFQYPNSDLRPVFKVQLTSDNRFTADAGPLMHFMSPVSETTYPIPRITDDGLPNVPIYSTVYQPIYRPFTLPNPYLQNPALSPPLTHNHIIPPPQKAFNTHLASSHQSFNSPFSLTRFGAFHPKFPHTYATLNYYHDDYVTSQIFNDLSSLIGRTGYDVPFGF